MHNSPILKSWGFEIAALVGTMATTSAMVGLLANYDGRPVFTWYNITLNTVISTLSVAMKALILFPAAECIGQWKWILLYRSRRTLIDFELIDQASRGPLGCFNLVWRKNTDMILRLGLITILLTIAVDPFSQQLLQLQQNFEYVEKLNDTYATTLRVTDYDGGAIINANVSLSTDRTDGDIGDTRQAVPEFAMQAAILNGLMHSYQSGGVATCPTGNCTWEPFDTLAVCHRCADLTDKLEKVDDFGDFFNMMNEDDPESRISLENATAVALPNGQFLANENGYDDKRTLGRGRYILTAYSTGDWNKTLSFKSMDTLIHAMTIIYIDGRQVDKYGQPIDIVDGRWPEMPVTAMECAAYFCVKTIHTKMKNNILTEEAKESKNWERDLISPSRESHILEEEINPSLQFDRAFRDVNQASLRIQLNGTVYAYNGTSYTYNGISYLEIQPSAYLSITALLEDTLTDTWHNETKYLIRVRKRIPNLEHMFSGRIIGLDDFKPGALNGLWSDYTIDLERIFGGLANSMTNDIRKNGYTSRIGDVPEVRGMIGVPRIAYRVIWYWFSLHGLILIGSFAFCVETMMISYDVPVWKSHSLATMSQGHILVDFGPDARSLQELEKRARSVQVNLSGDDADKLRPQDGHRHGSWEDASSGMGDGIKVDVDRRGTASQLLCG